MPKFAFLKIELQRFVCGKTSCRFPYFTVDHELSEPPKCYRCVTEGSLNARQAGEFCAKDGRMSNPSKLATPTDLTWNQILQEGCPGKKWIGYAWNMDINKWQWNHNDQVTKSSNWGNLGVSNDMATGKRCAIMNDQGKWKPTACDRKLKFVCERQQPYVLSGCDMPLNKGRLWHNDHTYYPQVPPAQRMFCFFFHENKGAHMVYSDAERFCTQSGGHIMMPKTKWQEVRILGELVNYRHKTGKRPRDKELFEWIYDEIAGNNPDVWVEEPSITVDQKRKRSTAQISTVLGSNKIWYGADNIGYCYNQLEWCPASPNSFKYLDGNWLNYHSFPSGDGPDNSAHAEGCIEVDTDDHTWNDVNCDNNKAVVCQVEHSYIRTHANWDWLMACNPIYDAGRFWYLGPRDVCYYTLNMGHINNQGFDQMVSKINKWHKNVQVARPHTREQMRALVLSRSFGYSGFFAGDLWSTLGLLSTKFGEWKWVNIQDGSDYVVNKSEFNWEPGHPLRPPGGGYPKQCAGFASSGKWRSYPCTERRPVSCESPAVASLSQWQPRPWARRRKQRKDKVNKADAAKSDKSCVRPHFSIVVISLTVVLHY